MKIHFHYQQTVDLTICNDLLFECDDKMVKIVLF